MARYDHGIPDRVLIFANPIAGRGRGRVVGANLQKALTAAGYQADLFLDRPSSIAPVDRSAIAAVCIGGDGSLRGVANLLFDQQSTGPPLLPIPMGTANLMGQYLNLRWRRDRLIEAVVETIRRREVMHIDTGRANGQLFLLVAGVGLDAQVVHLLDKARHGPIDLTSYLVPTAMAFAHYQFPAITVTVDATPIITETPAIVLIGNVKQYGTGVPILTRAIPTDGLLDICIMRCRHWRDLVQLLLLIAIGEHLHHESVTYLRGKTIQIASSVGVPVQLDGDSAGFTPLSIEVMPGYLPMLKPVV